MDLGKVGKTALWSDESKFFLETMESRGEEPSGLLSARNLKACISNGMGVH